MVGIIQRGLRLVLRIVDTIDYLVSLDDILYSRIFCLAYFLLNRKNLVLRSKIIIKIYLSENKEVTLLMQQNW